MKTILSIALITLLAGCGDEVSTEKHTVVKEKKEAAVVVKTEAKKVIKVEEKVVAKTLTGKELFMKCSSCHGLNAEKSALNKSRPIKGWSIEKIKIALNGYKDGTYGGSMKGIMQGQAKALSDADVQALSTYISKL